MNGMPELWWSPTHGLIKCENGMRWLLTNGPLLEDGDAPLPADAVKLDRDRGTDYIRVGETVSTQDRTDTYRLASGPQAMYLEPVDPDKRHKINFEWDRWTIMHPLSCRPNLFACPFNEATAALTEDVVGVFSCELDDAGQLIIGGPVE